MDRPDLGDESVPTNKSEQRLHVQTDGKLGYLFPLYALRIQSHPMDRPDLGDQSVPTYRSAQRSHVQKDGK